MLDKPKFRDCFQVEIIESEGIFLLSEQGSTILSDRLSLLVAPLIDGDRTVDQIIDRLQDRASAAELYYTFMQMEQNGYLVEAASDSDSSAFLDFLQLETKAIERLETNPVAVQTVGKVSAQPLIALLQALKIPVADRAEHTVVLTDHYLHPDLARWNQKFLQAGQAWLLAKPSGIVNWIGPIFDPNQTGCWQCLAQRLRLNYPIETFVEQRTGKRIAYPTATDLIATDPITTAHLSTSLTGLQLTASEIVKWLLRSDHLIGRLSTFDPVSFKLEHHSLVRRPQCSDCGSISCSEPVPIELQSRQKTRSNGGYRCLTPEATWAKYQHHISPVTGVVRSLKRLDSTEIASTHTYIGEYSFPVIANDLSFLRQRLRERSGGKGKTDLEAKVSGLCESIERHCGFFQGDEVRIKATQHQLGKKAIHPNTCMNFSEAQYRDRQQWNATASAKQRVPEPFDSDAEIEWTPVWSLVDQTYKYLPTAYCFYGYPSQTPFCWANSNGNAAGNTIEEAILQGCLELIERDSIALWWYNRVNRPAVDLDSFDQPYFSALKHQYAAIDREFWVLDVTSDFKIPVFVAISRKLAQSEEIIFGFGSHLEPQIAITRALTELNQALTSITAATKLEPQSLRPHSLWDASIVSWWQTATVKNQPYLLPQSLAPRTGDDYSFPQHDDLHQDVSFCLDRVKSLGMDLLILDQTRSDIGLNVVKVIIPGLRHYWKRSGPGRLYDIPVQLGWLSQPLSENQLNSFTVF